MFLRSCATLSLLALIALSCSKESDDAESDEVLLSELPLAIDTSAIDRSVRPCDDFYAFACGGYLKQHPPTDPLERHDRAFDAAADASQAAVAKIVEEAIAKPASAADERLGAFYSACKQAALTPTEHPADAAFLRERSDALARVLVFSGLGGALAEIARHSAQVPFFAITTGPEVEGSVSKNVLQVAPSRRHVTDEAELAKAMDRLYFDEPAEARSARAAKILPLERALADATATMDPRSHPVGRVGLERAAPHVGWQALLEGIGLGDAERVHAFDLNAFARVDAVLASASPESIAAYLDWKHRAHFTLALTTGSSAMPGPFAELTAKLKCDLLLERFASGLVMRRFVDAMVDTKADKQSRAMARAVLTAFEQRLATTDFLDTATRIEAQTKRDALLVTPLRQKHDELDGVVLDRNANMENWRQLWLHRRKRQFASVDRVADRTSLDDVGFLPNAFYSPLENRIAMLPGILTGPFFGANAASVLNFGALGWVIGHEITHGFDDNGRHFDAHGRERDWWSPPVASAFEERAACFVAQYSSFEVPEAIDAATSRPRTVDGAVTLGENIADNGGMRAAYDAAQKFFARTPTTAGFTPEQQFFVAGAQMWCETMGADAAHESLDSDVHAVGRARVNVTVSNFERSQMRFSVHRETA
jgi:putative endopeptidase